MDENLLDRWGRRVRDWAGATEQRTEEVARVAKCQVELLQIEWDLFRKRAALGQCVSRLLARGELPGWDEHPELAGDLAGVRTLEQEEREKKDEIEEIRRGTGGTPSGPAES